MQEAKANYGIFEEKGMRSKILSRIRDNQGVGEYISFAFLAMLICIVMVTIMGFSQLSTNMNRLNNTLSVVSRTVAVADSYESALENAKNAADSSIVETPTLKNVQVTIEVLNGDRSAESWKAGTRALVTISADVITVSPFSSGRQTRQAIVSIERTMSGLLAGSLSGPGSVTKNGSLGSTYPLTSGFGKREAEIEGMSTTHYGLDFGMPSGTELVAPANGIVKYTGYDGSRGNWIVMYVGEGYYVLYQHLSIITAHAGQSISKGDTVAFSGNSGVSTGAHLHLEVLYSPDQKDSLTYYNGNQNRINPYSFVFGGLQVTKH